MPWMKEARKTLDFKLLKSSARNPDQFIKLNMINFKALKTTLDSSFDAKTSLNDKTALVTPPSADEIKILKINNIAEKLMNNQKAQKQAMKKQLRVMKKALKMSEHAENSAQTQQTQEVFTQEIPSVENNETEKELVDEKSQKLPSKSPISTPEKTRPIKDFESPQEEVGNKSKKQKICENKTPFKQIHDIENEVHDGNFQKLPPKSPNTTPEKTCPIDGFESLQAKVGKKLKKQKIRENEVPDENSQKLPSKSPISTTEKKHPRQDFESPQTKVENMPKKQKIRENKSPNKQKIHEIENEVQDENFQKLPTKSPILTPEKKRPRDGFESLQAKVGNKPKKHKIRGNKSHFKKTHEVENEVPKENSQKLPSKSPISTPEKKRPRNGIESLQAKVGNEPKKQRIHEIQSPFKKIVHENGKLFMTYFHGIFFKNFSETCSYLVSDEMVEMNIPCQNRRCLRRFSNHFSMLRHLAFYHNSAKLEILYRRSLNLANLERKK